MTKRLVAPAIRQGLLLLVAPFLTWALVACASNSIGGEPAASAPPSSASTPTPSPTKTPTPTPTSTTYTAADKSNFVVAVQTDCPEVWASDNADSIVELADSMIDAHPTAWNDILTALEKSYSEEESKIFASLVVTHLMPWLPSDDPWKVEATAVQQEQVSEPEPADYEPKKSDVKVTLKTKEKQCFGSAGCLIEVEPRVTLQRANIPDGTLTIYYTIKGASDGAVEGSIDVEMSDGKGSYDRDSVSVDTERRSSKLSVKVTDVEHY